MAARVFETPNEKAISGALALAMHALFFAMLVFSVTWQKHEPAAMVADLWSDLPSPKAEIPPPPPRVEPQPPRVEPKPVPKAEPKPQPKAEIDLREKKEKERKAQEQEKAEKMKRQEQEKAEKKKRQEQEKAEAVKLQQAKEAADAKRRAQEQADALKRLAQQQAAAQAGEVAKYKAAIAARIKRFIVEPPNVQGNPVAELDIIMLPSGEVLDVKTRKSSGQTAWDNACERAIRRAQPLPLPPPDSAIFNQFRELNHACRFKE